MTGVQTCALPIFTVAAISVVLGSLGKAADPTPAELSQQWQRAAGKAIFRMREVIVDERELARGRLLRQMIQVGDFDAALESSKEIRPASRLVFLSNMGQELKDLGRENEALDLAKRVAGEMEKLSTTESKPGHVFWIGDMLDDVIRFQCVMGEFDQARKILAHLRPEWERGQILFMASGKTLELPSLRANAMFVIAEELARQGKLDAAQRSPHKSGYDTKPAGPFPRRSNPVPDRRGAGRRTA